MRLKKRLLVLVLTSVLVLSGVLSPVLPVSAASSNLYGTGSADDINIIRILDMALNKGGMSMSPSTIQAFLDFWWTSVQTDLNKCIANVDTSITGTEAFVDALSAALESADHYDRLGQIIKKYVRFVMTMDYKSLSDFKQLLTQQGTFRRFLLSYVVDQDDNIAGAVDNKLVKYQLKTGFISMVRQAVDVYIEEYEGYYLVPTFTYRDFSSLQFSSKSVYDAVYGSFQTLDGDMVVSYHFTQNYAVDLSGYNLILSSGGVSDYISNGTVVDHGIDIRPYNDDWQQIKYKYTDSFSSVIDLTDPDNYPRSPATATYCHFPVYSNLAIKTTYLFTSDGRSVKVWKSLDAYKQYSVGKQNIYYTKDYDGFDESKDTGYTFTGTQYNGGYSHDIIQTTIDNSSEVNESTINNIVNNYITNNYGDGSGSGTGSDSGSGNDWWNIGDGITSFIKGVAALLDFLLKLLGDLIGVISDFLVGLLAVLEKLGAVGSSFGDFLKVFFGFLPEEIIDMIIVSIGFIVVAGVIKMFKG